jgi:hypothetical protein
MNKFRAFPLLLISFVVSLLVNFGCASSPGPLVEEPLFSISVADSITYTSAGLTISVTAGSEEYNEFGVCWKVVDPTSVAKPTVAGSHLVLSTSFSSVSGHVKLTGLTPSTHYTTSVYIRYADGRYEYSTTSISFTTIGLTDPTLNTSVISGITATTAIGGGNITSDGGVPITARGICWTTSGNNPTIADNKTVDGSGIGSFISNLTGLTAGVSYKVVAYATNTRGTFYGTPMVFSSATVLPSLTTEGAIFITGTTATLVCNVDNDGGSAITGRGVCWSTTLHPTTSDSELTYFSNGLLGYSIDVKYLLPNTTYYYRAYASNGIGTAYGNEMSFKTPVVLPVVTTDAVIISGYATATAGGTFTFGGKVVSVGGDSNLTKGVEWYIPNTFSANFKDIGGSASFNITITNALLPATTYSARAFATNSAGTAYGAVVTFTTLTPTPLLTTSNVAWLTSTTAVGGGNITDDRGVTTTRGICWGLSSGPTTANSKTVDSSTGVGSYVSNMTGLIQTISTYYVRAYATSIYGTFYGNEISFRNTALLISTAFPSNLGSTTVISGGIIATDGGLSVTQRGVCWSTSSGPTTAGSKLVDSSTGIGSYGSSITGLTSGTTYYLRAYAITSSGTSYGEEVTFKTTSLATLTTTAGAVVDMNSATSGGNITNNGGATVTSRGICWSMSPNPTLADSKTTDGSGSGIFTSTLTSLQIGGTYHIRAYAVNSVGTSYGNDVTYVVDSSEGAVIMTELVTQIMATSAVCGGIVFNDGGFAITSRGVCWNTSSNPTTANSKTVDGSGLGTFVSNMTGLSPNVTYHVRSYVVSSHGTTYGSEFSFTTHP